MNKFMKKNIIVIITMMCIVSSALLGVDYYNVYQAKEAFLLKESLLPVHVEAIYINNTKINTPCVEKTTKEMAEELISLYKQYDINSIQESIVIKGVVARQLSKEERSCYAQAILRNLKAKQMGYYREAYAKNSEIYYGFTPKIKVHMYDANQKKNNLQISFQYNETLKVTEIVVAIPFYNEIF